LVMNHTVGVPGWLKLFFWDVRVEDLNIHDNHIFIIERLLNEGDQDALCWLFSMYDEERIKEAVLAGRGLSLKTARCWQNYFDLEEEQMHCFGPRSTSPKRLC